MHLLGLIAAAIVPVWLFAAYLLSRYAINERERFELDARQTARQASLVVEAELSNQLTLLRGLSRSTELAGADLGALRAEAVRLVEGTGQAILLRGFDGSLLLDTDPAS